MDSDLEQSDLIIYVVSSVVSFIVGGGLTKLIDSVRRVKTTPMSNVVSSVLNVYASLHAIQRHNGAGRVTILRISNGGANPHPSKTLYATPVYEVASTCPVLSTTWGERRVVDEEFALVLDRLIRQEELTIVTADSPNSMLKDVSAHDGVCRSKLHVLFETPDHNLMVMLIDWVQQPSTDEKRVLARRVATASQLSKIREHLRETT